MTPQSPRDGGNAAIIWLVSPTRGLRPGGRVRRPRCRHAGGRGANPASHPPREQRQRHDRPFLGCRRKLATRLLWHQAAGRRGPWPELGFGAGQGFLSDAIRPLAPHPGLQSRVIEHERCGQLAERWRRPAPGASHRGRMALCVASAESRQGPVLDVTVTLQSPQVTSDLTDRSGRPSAPGRGNLSRFPHGRCLIVFNC